MRFRERRDHADAPGCIAESGVMGAALQCVVDELMNENEPDRLACRHGRADRDSAGVAGFPKPPPVESVTGADIGEGVGPQANA